MAITCAARSRPSTTVAPSADEMAQRHRDARAAGLPFLVAADRQGAILGFAYAGYFRPRAAYRFTLEDSIYVAPEVTRRGIGRALLMRIVEEATAAGYRQMVAMIGDSANAASIGLHEKAGLQPRRSLIRGRLQARPLDRLRRDAARARPGIGDAAALPSFAQKKRAAPKRGPSLGRKRLEDVRQVIGRRPMPQCTIWCSSTVKSTSKSRVQKIIFATF